VVERIPQTQREILSAALPIVQRDHSSTQLAVNAEGVRVPPTAPLAVSWSSAGAIIHVAPSRAKWPGVQHTSAAFDAYGLLEDAAKVMGYPNPAMVDVAGPRRAVEMFLRAINAAPDEPRRAGRSHGVGSRPRGVVA
jgi:hypothetical protein